MKYNDIQESGIDGTLWKIIFFCKICELPRSHTSTRQSTWNHAGEKWSRYSNWMGWTKCQQFLLRASFIVGLGGFLFGYDIGIISGALQQLKHHFHLSNYEAGLVVSFLPLGSIFGCIFGGPLCDKIGRWWTIHLQNFTFIFGAIIMSTATSLSSLYLGRFILGIASALSAVADIPYLTEVSPSAYRGLVSSAYEILVVVGILVSFIIALCLVENNANSSWRIMFFVPISFSVIQSIGLLSLPESPQWLIENSQPEKAKIILEQIFDTPEEVLQRMDELTAHCSARLSGITLSSRIYFRQYLVPILVIVTLMFFQQFTGGVVVRNYAPKIFHLAGYGDVASLKFTVILGVVKVLVTGWAILRIDTLGRRPLLLSGVALIGLGMLILSISFAIGMQGKSEDAWSSSSSSPSLHAISIMIVFILACSLITAGYSVGFGPVSWLLQSELFPTIIRGRTMALSVLVSNCTQFLSNLFFLPLIQLIGDSFTFLVYFAMCCLGGIFIYFYLIETKEQEPDEILEAYRVLIGRYSANWKSCWSFLCGKDRMDGEGAGIGIRAGVSRTQQQRGIQFVTVSNVLQDEGENEDKSQGQREEQEEKVK